MSQPKVRPTPLGERISVRFRAGTHDALGADEAATIRRAIRQWCDDHADAILAEPAAHDHVVGEDLDGHDVATVTFRTPRALVDDIDTLVDRGVAPTRSRAIREAVREHIDHGGDGCE